MELQGRDETGDIGQMMSELALHAPADEQQGEHTAVALPQIVIGAYIALTTRQLYSIYAVCGRAWAISPMLDQQIGGLLTWIPAAMMSAVGGIVVIYRVLSEERRRLAPEVTDPSGASAGAPA